MSAPATTAPDGTDTALDVLATRLEALLPGAVQRAVPAAQLTTYRLGGPLSVLVRVHDDEGLAAVAAALAELGEPVPVIAVGRGSNLLVADAGFAGLAVALAGDHERVEGLDGDGRAAGDDVDIVAGGAVPLPVLARRSAAAGCTGLEFYVGIPGSVGGAVRMNAGGHGRQTADVVTAAWVVGLGAVATLPSRREADALGFGYRCSALGPGEIVVRAELRATVAPEPAAPGRLVDEIVRWRRANQPGGSNAGSVFRNPAGDAAGRLIDAAGLKGLRVGGAVVSSKHANFFQADDGARAADVAALVREVQRRVLDASGVDLVAELTMVGFEDLPE